MEDIDIAAIIARESSQHAVDMEKSKAIQRTVATAMRSDNSVTAQSAWFLIDMQPISFLQMNSKSTALLESWGFTMLGPFLREIKENGIEGLCSRQGMEYINLLDIISALLDMGLTDMEIHKGIKVEQGEYKL